MGLKFAASAEKIICIPRTLCSKLGRYFSLLTVIVLIASLISGSAKVTKYKSTNIVFLHLLSFAAHFGAQCWVTFLAGFATFFSLPRIMFGHLHSRLFPLYFTSTLVLSCITLLTYVIQHPYATMTSSETKQLIGLSVCVVSTFVNSFYLAPEIVDAMISVFKIEKSRFAYVVGYCDKTHLKKDLKYAKHYRRFRYNHNVSGLANLTTLICNAIYLYQLASDKFLV